MADWTFTTGNALTRKAWAKKWWIEAKTESFFYGNGLVGVDEENDIIVDLRDLEAEQGDNITYGQIRELSGGGVSGDGNMEGNEEAPVTYDDDVTLDQQRNAIRLKGRVSGQRPSDKRLRNKANTLLKRWMAEKIDQDLFNALGTSPTKVIYGGDATTPSDVEAGDYMTLSLIDQAAVYSKKATPKIMGKMVNGKRHYCWVGSPDQASDIRQRDAAWNQNQMNATMRSEKNRVFGQALGIYSNTVLYDHERVATTITWGTGGNLAGATSLFMGVGSGVIAYAKRKIWNEKTFDYMNKVGFCIGAIYGVSKSVFNSADNAVVAIRTFRSNF